MKKVFLIICFLLLLSFMLQAENISLKLDIEKITDGNLIVLIENTGDTDVHIKNATLNIHIKDIKETLWHLEYTNMIRSGQQISYQVEQTLTDNLNLYGKYNISMIVKYLNGNKELSSIIAKQFLFNSDKIAEDDISLSVDTGVILHYGTISIKAKDESYLDRIEPILPDEIQISEIEKTKNTISYNVTNSAGDLDNSYKIYFYINNVGDIHNTKLFETTLKTGPFQYNNVNNQNLWFFFTVLFISIFVITFIIGLMLWYRKNSNLGVLLVYLSIVLTASFFTYFNNYDYPYEVFWDENYHITSAQKYIDGVYFQESHPPLGKLFVALGEHMFDLNQQVDTEPFLTTSYIKKPPKGYSFIGVRFWSSLFAFLSAGLIFLIFYLISKSANYSLLFSSLYIFENAIIVQSRGAMLDGIQIFFILAAILYFIYLFNKGRKLKIIEYFALGLIVGISISIKINAIIILLLFVALAFKEYYRSTLNFIKKSLSLKRISIKHINTKKIVSFSLKTLASTLGVGFIFCLSFYIHFNLASKAKNNNFYEASEKTQEIIKLEKVSNPLNLYPLMKDYLNYMSTYAKKVPKWDPTKKGEKGSPAWAWAFGYKSINYRWAKINDKVAYVYLQGNPVIWYSVLFAVVISFIFIIGKYLWGVRINNSHTKRNMNLLLLFLILYSVYMISVLRVERVLYLYHYLNPLIFGMIILFILFNIIFKKAIESNDKLLYVATIIFIIEIFAVYSFFSDLSYYQPVSFWDFSQKAWFELWKLNPIR